MSKGFTLLEMTISLLIAAIALTAIYQTLGKSLVLEGRADQVTRAAIVAQSKLAEISALEPIRIGTNAGMDQGGISWQAKTTVLTTSSNSGDLRVLVEILVETFDSRDSNSLPLITLKSIAYAVPE